MSFQKKQSFIALPRPRRHEGYMHKRRKWPLKGWTKRCHNSFSWAYLTEILSAWSTFETLHFPGTFYWKEGALLMASLRWPELLKDWIYSSWVHVHVWRHGATHSPYILRLFFLCFSFHSCKTSHSVGRKSSFQQSFLLTQIDQVSDWLKLDRDSE